MVTQQQYDKTKQLLNAYFKVNGKLAGDEMSPGQIEIAASIIFKTNPRIACVAPTGYGKSEAVAMAVILCCAKNDEKFIIGSVKYDTSDIIMKKVIEHVFDSSEMVKELEMDTTQRLTTLKRERNKAAMNFRGGGSLKIVSLFGKDDDVSKAIGEHVPNIILDESPLLTPTKYLIILKILEGTGDYNKTFLFELGNAVNRNHFMFNIKSNSKYQKIDISLERAIAEGRLDTESVNEKRGLPFFEQFYECRFPAEDEIDNKGYRQLLTAEDIDAKMVGLIDAADDPMKLGVDVAGGGDYNVYCMRQGNSSWFETFNRSNDTMTNVNEVIRIIDKYTITDNRGKKIRLLKPEDVFIDDIGIGRGVVDRLREMKTEFNGKVAYYSVTGVAAGEKSSDPSRYSNKKAENYWLSRLWMLKEDSKILANDKWHQLKEIKYKDTSDKVLQIEPKADLKKRTGKSPDYAEAFMLTFTVPPPEPNVTWL